MNKVFQDIYELVWKEVFPKIPVMDIEKFKKLYLGGIYVPEAHRSALNPEIEVYSSPEYGYKRLISREQQYEMDDKGGWAQEKEPIGSLSSALEKVSRVALFSGSRNLNSEIVEASDDIYSSSYIYGSMHIYDCQKVLFGYNNLKIEYMVASKGNKESSFGIRIVDSGSVTNSFEIHWCEKTVNSYFCFGCVDVRDCMFCFQLRSKQYCIANMQFEKEEYEQLRDKLLEEYFAQIDDPNGFKVLADL